MSGYQEFLNHRAQLSGDYGFDPIEMHPSMFDFQRHLTEWALRKGRSAIFADCGLGKTLMQLTWADNVCRHTSGRVLIVTPLSVSLQTVDEAGKFGFDAERSSDGSFSKDIVITNYERLHHFQPSDFSGVVCDESSILKSFDGVRKSEITLFMRKIEHRLLCTATAAPNDYIELGTSSEALGYLGHVDMLGRFFKNDQGNVAQRRMYGEAPKWRFKGHAELPFWRWVTSWARACRRPSDLGFNDEAFRLPDLRENIHIVDAETLPDGMLFALPAKDIFEQRAERKRTIMERCEMAADLARGNHATVIWCHMNDEGNLLEKLIPDAVQVSGRDTDDAKETKFHDFSKGNTRVLITKPKIGAWGLNWQHASHIIYFPSHSYESYYQAVRRCWRFGQKNDVVVDIVMTEGERKVMDNLSAKSLKADKMFDNLVREMNNAEGVASRNPFLIKEEVPAWL